jgi:hypothetical protein
MTRPGSNGDSGVGNLPNPRRAIARPPPAQIVLSYRRGRSSAAVIGCPLPPLWSRASGAPAARSSTPQLRRPRRSCLPAQRSSGTESHETAWRHSRDCAWRSANECRRAFLDRRRRGHLNSGGKPPSRLRWVRQCPAPFGAWITSLKQRDVLEVAAVASSDLDLDQILDRADRHRPPANQSPPAVAHDARCINACRKV